MTGISDTTLKDLTIPTKDVEKAKGWWKKGQWDKIKGGVIINPLEEQKLGPFGYDLSVGDQYVSLREGYEPKSLKEEERLVIEPGDTVLILTKEYIALPRNIFLIVEPRAKMIFEGLNVRSTRVEPTWYGKLIIGVTNNSKDQVGLYNNDSFCTMMPIRLDKDVKKILTKDKTKFLGQESIKIHLERSHQPWKPKKEEEVSKEDMEQVIEQWGPPFDIVKGSLKYTKEEIRYYIDKVWGPQAAENIEKVAVKEAFGTLKWFCGAVIIVLLIAVLGLLFKG